MKIRPATKQDARQLTDLANAYLSFGTTRVADFERAIESQQVLVSEEKGRVVGTISLQRIHQLEPFLLGHKDVVKALPEKSYHTIGVFVVEEAHRGGFHAYRLAERVMQESKNVPLLVVGWVQPAGWQAESLARKFGFQHVMDKPLFWQADSLTHGYGCPHCLNGCSCTARIMVRDANLLLDKNTEV